jgi:hypothetical protein
MTTFFKTMMIWLLISSTIPSFAQDTTKADKKIREYALSLTSFSSMNVYIRYKRQIKGRTFFKVELINLSGSRSENKPEISSSYGSTQYNLSGGLQCGLEFRKSITNAFTFFHGPNIGLICFSNIAASDNPSIPADETKSFSQNYSLGIPYSLGILFHLNNHFFMSAEINPAVSATWGFHKNSQSPSDNNTQFTTSFGFANSYGLLSLIYRL